MADLKTSLELWASRGRTVGAAGLIEWVEADLRRAAESQRPPIGAARRPPIPSRGPIIALAAAMVIVLAIGSLALLTRGNSSTPTATTSPPATVPQAVEPLGPDELPQFPDDFASSFAATVARNGATLRILYSGTGPSVAVEVIEQWSSDYSAAPPYGFLAEGGAGSVYVFDGGLERTWLERDGILEEIEAAQGFDPLQSMRWNGGPQGIGDWCARVDHEALGTESVAGNVVHVISCSGLGQSFAARVESSTGLILSLRNDPRVSSPIFGDYELTSLTWDPTFTDTSFDGPQTDQTYEEYDPPPSPPRGTLDESPTTVAERRTSLFREMSDHLFTLGAARPDMQWPGPSELSRGEVVPALTGTFLDGSPFDISDYLGAPLVILSWSPHPDAIRIPDRWTPNEDVRDFPRIAARWDDVQFVSLIRSYEEPAADPDLAAEVLETLGVSIPVIVPSDGTGWNYAPGAPFNTWLLIDEHGFPLDGFYNSYPVEPMIETLLASLDRPPLTTGTWGTVEELEGCSTVVEAVGDDVWVAGSCGVWKISGATAEELHSPVATGFTDLAVRDGVVWANTGVELLRDDGQGWLEYAGGFQSIALGVDGALWAVDRDTGSLWILDEGASVVGVDFRAHSVEVSRDGRVWVSGVVAGEEISDTMLLPERAVLLRFDGGTWSNVADVPSIKGTSDWLVSLPDGTVWGSDPVGLFKVSGRGVGRWDYRWSDLSDTIRDAARDQFGRIWLATSEGARLLNGSTWILFTVEDGLPSNDLTSVSVSADGTLWFGTTDTGVASFTPDSEQTSQTE